MPGTKLYVEFFFLKMEARGLKIPEHVSFISLCMGRHSKQTLYIRLLELGALHGGFLDGIQLCKLERNENLKKWIETYYEEREKKCSSNLMRKVLPVILFF